MKKCMPLFFLFAVITGICFAESSEKSDGSVESRIDLSFYFSTRGEMQMNFLPRWKLPFLRGESPLTRDNNLALKLDASLSPIWAGISGDAVLTVAPFLSFTLGAQAGTGWNYDLFGKIPLVGLGLNRKTTVGDPNDGVTGNGLDGAVWNIHAGTTIQFDLAALFPGDWNHVVIQIYNDVQYFAYTKARGADFWYYLGDDGMNQNAFRHTFTGFIGYAMPFFLDLIGYQLSGTMPFYNTETGGSVKDIGYSLTNAFLLNFKLTNNFSIMTIARVTNGLKAPITSAYKREWGFDRVQFIAAWRIK